MFKFFIKLIRITIIFCLFIGHGLSWEYTNFQRGEGDL